MQFHIVTIFPDMFKPVINESIIKLAIKKKLIKIKFYDLRDYTSDKHRKVDDRPYGGGSGMVFTPEPVFRAVEHILRTTHDALRTTKTILLSPQGKKLNQSVAKRLSGYKNLVLICPRYEGIDERVKKGLVDEEISIGDYVLTGGELPAMVLIDAVTRLIPGVLGDKNSLIYESFQGNLLEYPQYTRPQVFMGFKVPAILLSGDHEKIKEWRKKESLKTTKKKRPDLWRSHGGR